MIKRNTYTVSEIVSTIKSKLDLDDSLQRIIVSGEISNFTAHRSGHWYFTLKDANARISCVMFASAASRCTFRPTDGMKVFVLASTSLFEASGALQLYVQQMKMDGVGDLYQQFELLKKKLYEEGLFDPAHKKKIPGYPERIGIVVGKNTAAREDIITTIHRRWPVASITELNPLVQGKEASKQIISALSMMDSQNFDVILLARGGGSIEDLWAFNDEALARFIYQMKTPVITGVGHEVDTTIVDYVSDRRAPTPTGAAEMATPDIRDILMRLDQCADRFENALEKRLKENRANLVTIKAKKFFSNPASLIDNKKMSIELIKSRLYQCSSMTSTKRNELNNIKHQMEKSISSQLITERESLLKNKMVLTNETERRLQLEKSLFVQKVQLLDAYSPLKSLARGYSLVQKEDKLIHSINQVELNDEIQITLSDGKMKGTIISKED